MKVPLAGGAATVLFPGDERETSVFKIVVDAANLIWSGNGSGSSRGVVMTMPIAGGEPATLLSGLFEAPIFQMASGNLYYTDLAGSGINSGVIARIAIHGSDPPLTLAQGQSLPGALAVAGDTVYWGGGALDTTSSLRYPSPVTRLAGEGRSPEVLVPSSVTYAMVLCPGGICWTDADAGAVMRYHACPDD